MHDLRLQFNGLSKSYGSTTAVSDLSLDVYSGEIVGLIGPDGAGKTTAMRIACALLLPDGGTVTIMGNDVVRAPLRVKEHLGYMPQRFSLYPDLSVAENLRFFAAMYDVPPAERQAREERLLKFSRLEPFRHRRAGQLSGGMKQKLALSCTMIHTPDVLILDEPTTGVDPVSRREFWTILRELAGTGQALLVSTPYMDEAVLCDRVALMHRGRTMVAGTPQQVTAAFSRKLLEISGADLDRARRELRPLAAAGVEVNRFGDRLHIIYDTTDDEGRIRQAVTTLDVTLRPVAPTIEDTFVALMSAQKDAA